MQGVAWKHMRRHTNLRQNGYIIFAFNTTWRCLSGQREASGWNILDQSLYYTARAFFKNPKAWGPGPLKFLFLNASKIKPQEAEGPSNSSGILSYVLHASAQFGAGLNEVTRWSWQIWQEACDFFFLEPEKKIGKAGLIWVSWEQCGKKQFSRAWKIVFFAKPGLSEFHKVSVQKTIF